MSTQALKYAPRQASPSDASKLMRSVCRKPGVQRAEVRFGGGDLFYAFAYRTWDEARKIVVDKHTKAGTQSVELDVFSREIQELEKTPVARGSGRTVEDALASLKSALDPHPVAK